MDRTNCHILSNGNARSDPEEVIHPARLEDEGGRPPSPTWNLAFLKKCQRVNRNVFYVAKSSRAEVAGETPSVREPRAADSLGEAGQAHAARAREPEKRPSARPRPSPPTNLQPRCRLRASWCWRQGTFHHEDLTTPPLPSPFSDPQP